MENYITSKNGDVSKITSSRLKSDQPIDLGIVYKSKAIVEFIDNKLSK